MIDKEKLKIFFTIITLIVSAECDFLDEINVAIKKLQDTVDKISLENAKTNEKMDKMQSDMTFMKDASRKSFENAENLQADFHTKTSVKLDQLNKMIQNIERRVDEASDAIVLVQQKINDGDNRLDENTNILNKLENDTKSLGLEMNSSIADLDNKFSLIEGNNAIILKSLEVSKFDLREGQNELKTLNLNMNSKLEKVCSDNLVAISSSVTALAGEIDKIDENMNGAKGDILLEIDNNQVDLQKFLSVIMQNKKDIIYLLHGMVKLVGGKNAREGLVYVQDKPVCDDHWDDKDATVVCRMLGFSSGIAFFGPGAGAGNGHGLFGNVTSANFIMDNVECKGPERTIFDCKHKTTHNCNTNEGAGVRCFI